MKQAGRTAGAVVAAAISGNDAAWAALEKARQVGAKTQRERERFRTSRLGTKGVYIEPGSPWENGYCESFNGSETSA